MKWSVMCWLESQSRDPQMLIDDVVADGYAVADDNSFLVFYIGSLAQDNYEVVALYNTDSFVRAIRAEG